MKIKKVQKNIRLIPRNSKGFALLFSILLSSIILSIALGVGNIAFREIQFGTSAKNTNEAFFAADTGVECALYNDNSVVNSFPESGGPSSITCGGSSISLSGTSPSWNFIISGLGASNQSCAKVSVVKTFSPDSTQIISKGYNVGDSNCNSTINRTERELVVNSVSMAPVSYTKIVLHEDMLSQSGAISMSSAGTVDGNTSTFGFDTDGAPSGSWLKIDLGFLGGPSESVLRARLYSFTANYSGNYTIQYSDNNSTWSNAITGFIPSLLGWNEIVWDSVGSHRYWRLYLTNTPGPGPDIYELELYK
jgi:hypothetical protein